MRGSRAAPNHWPNGARHVGLVAFITILASSTTASNNATIDRTRSTALLAFEVDSGEAPWPDELCCSCSEACCW